MSMRSAPWSALGKSLLPCSLSPPLCLGSQSSCVLLFLIRLICSKDASKVFLLGPHSGRPRTPHFLCQASQVLLSLVSCHSSWIVMSVCHQHDTSLLLLRLQCPTSCAICISWVVAEVPPPLIWLAICFCIGCLIYTCIPDISVVCQYAHLILLCLP